jgi:hypothetical protein
MTTTARALMAIASAIPTVLGVVFGLADTALLIWLLIHTEWIAAIVLVFVISPLAATVGGWIVGGLAMAFYGVARLCHRPTAEAILETW